MINIDTIHPKPWKIIWRDDDSSMNMGIIVDANFKGESGNVGDFDNLPQENVVCVFYHQDYPKICKFPDETGDGMPSYLNAIATAEHIIKIVNQE